MPSLRAEPKGDEEQENRKWIVEFSSNLDAVVTKIDLRCSKKERSLQ